ncbi:MAG TPA: cytidylate kinase-like family protein [Bacteroidales bacterium]|nr:cytidylate kinase-like family protein [Bacteroidales bacterium]
MQGDLISYLKHRYEETQKRHTGPGPVITISREYGCPAKLIAEKLANELSAKHDEQGHTHLWKWYSKEILEESAKELQMDPSKIKYVFEYEKKSALEDFFGSFGQYYQSDKKIRATIGRVIREIGENGHAIIVGRGGIAITRDIADSLHINLVAPLEWRTVRISQRYDLTLENARQTCIDIDKKRAEFRDFFQGKNNDYTSPDLTINCMSFTVDEIVKILVKTVETRKLIY